VKKCTLKKANLGYITPQP